VNNISTFWIAPQLWRPSGLGAFGGDRTVLEMSQNVLSEIDREANVAGLSTSTSYSVFISNDGSNGRLASGFWLGDGSALG